MILLGSNSPTETLSAEVSDEGGVLYLFVADGDEISYVEYDCWVANLRPAPGELERSRGRAPLMPRKYCAHPSGRPRPSPDALRLVWLESMDGVALLEHDDVLAVAYAHKQGAYARDCTAANPLAKPLHECPLAKGEPKSWLGRWLDRDANELLAKRIGRAEAFWKRWAKDDETWVPEQERILAAYQGEEALGVHVRYFAADGGGFPPRFVTVHERAGARFLISGGMSILHQPAVNYDGPNSRVEVAVALSRNEDVEHFARSLSGMASFPWRELTWLGHGHTISLAPIHGSKAVFEAALLVREPDDVPRVSLSTPDGHAVSILWVVPITEAEREFAKVYGSAELLTTLKEHGITMTFSSARASVA